MSCMEMVVLKIVIRLKVDEVALLTTFDIHPSALDFFFLLFFDRYSFCCSASTFFLNVSTCYMEWR